MLPSLMKSLWLSSTRYFIALIFVSLSAMVLCDNEMWCGSYDEQLIKVVDVEVISTCINNN